MSDNTLDEQIADVFSALFEIKVTALDVRQCKPEFVQKIYFHCIRDFGANLELVNQLPFDVCESVQQHADLYRSTMRIVALSKVIKMFFKLLCDDDSFMPADLFDPKPARTKQFFKVLVEFFYSSNEYSESMNRIEEQVSIKRESRDRLLANIEKAKAKIRHLKLENAENQISEEQELERIAEVKAQLQECQNKKLNMKAAMENIKMCISTLTTNIKDAKLEVIENEEKLEKLASQVVQASERQEIEERERKLSFYRSESQARSERLVEMKQVLRTHTAAIETLNNELKVVALELQQEFTKKKEIQAELSELDRSKASLLEAVEDKDAQIQQLLEQLAAREDKVSQMQQSWRLKQEGLLDEINQNKLLLEEVLRNRTEDEIVAQDMEAERVRILQETQQLHEELANITNFIAKSYKSIMAARKTTMTCRWQLLSSPSLLVSCSLRKVECCHEAFTISKLPESGLSSIDAYTWETCTSSRG
nr:WEB family protein At5g55860-like isoform X1 [Procambarus clarkii]XP_045594163.1 WEB family protein At5g55860-like isoform X1 [Procambarus clarkii]